MSGIIPERQAWIKGITRRQLREKEARKVAMYFVKGLCDRTSQQTAEKFGVGGYGVVGWVYHTIRARMKPNR